MPIAKMPKVYNKHHKNAPADAVYIGRPGKWGNPFVIGRGLSRKLVIEKYREWLASRPELVEAARRELAGKDLVCYCSPSPCHGDILLEVANANLQDGRRCLASN